jgi:hypothetical protein
MIMYLANALKAEQSGTDGGHLEDCSALYVLPAEKH